MGEILRSTEFLRTTGGMKRAKTQPDELFAEHNRIASPGMVAILVAVVSLPLHRRLKQRIEVLCNSARIEVPIEFKATPQSDDQLSLSLGLKAFDDLSSSSPHIWAKIGIQDPSITGFHLIHNASPLGIEVHDEAVWIGHPELPTRAAEGLGKVGMTWDTTKLGVNLFNVTLPLPAVVFPGIRYRNRMGMWYRVGAFLFLLLLVLLFCPLFLLVLHLAFKAVDN